MTARILPDFKILDTSGKIRSTRFLTAQSRFVYSVKNLATVLNENPERIDPRSSTSVVKNILVIGIIDSDLIAKMLDKSKSQ